jgi:hypothetical protein
MTKKSGDPGKRAFIKTVAIGVATGIVTVITSRVTLETRVAKAVFESFDDWTQTLVTRNMDLLVPLFGDFRLYDFNAGESHENYVGVHPDNAKAQQILQHVFEAEELKPVKSPGQVDLRRSLLLIGSPTSNKIVRPIFGYEEVGRNLVLTSDRHLRWNYVLDKREIGNQYKTWRYVGGQRRSVANWRVKDNKALFGDDELLPESYEDSWLKTDVLLISRLPHVLDSFAHDRGMTIAVIGGAHGSGTIACENLLTGRKYLEQIYSKVQPHKYWQALVKVEKIVHDHTKHVSTPTEVRVLDAQPITEYK